jgi:hypothetical protein
VQPINPDAFDAELDERRRQMQQDVGAPRPPLRTRILVVALLVALAAVVSAASVDARRARGHDEDVTVLGRVATPQFGGVEHKPGYSLPSTPHLARLAASAATRPTRSGAS